MKELPRPHAGHTTQLPSARCSRPVFTKSKLPLSAIFQTETDPSPEATDRIDGSIGFQSRWVTTSGQIRREIGSIFPLATFRSQSDPEPKKLDIDLVLEHNHYVYSSLSVTESCLLQQSSLIRTVVDEF